MIGLLIGLWYHQFKKINKKHNQKPLFHILWHCSYVCHFLLIFVGLYFYENNVEKNIFTAILSAFFKHIYGLVIGVLIVGLIFKYGHVFSKIFSHPMYRILGRLSFSVYMGHLSILMLLLVKSKNMSEIHNSTVVSSNIFIKFKISKVVIKFILQITYALGTYLISHLFALFLVLVIEIPVSIIFKTIINDSE